MHRSTRPLAVLSLSVLTLAGATAIAVPADRAERFAGGNWRRGETLYRQNCASCHSANLRGRGMAPSLLGVTRRMENHEIVTHARMIGERMCCARHIRDITDAEFADIVAYFQAVDRDPGVRRRAEQAGGGGGCCGMMGGRR